MANEYLNLVQQATPTGLSDPKKPNPYLDILRDDEARRRSSVNEATKISPEVAARSQRLAQQTGMPAHVVRQNLDDIERRQRAADLMSATALSPVLRAQLSNPEFAAIAQDDISNLAESERITSVWQALGIVPRGIASAVPALNKGFYGLGATIADAAGAKDTGKTLADWAKYYEGQQKRVAGPTGGWLGQQVQGAANSIGLMLPGIAASVGSGGAATPGVVAAYLAPGVVAQGGDSAMKAREAGKTPFEQLQYAGLDMAAEAIFERIPVNKLLGDIAQNSGVGKILWHQIANEVPTEVATTLYQNLNEWATINPDKPFSDFLNEQPAAIRDTIVQTSLGAVGSTAIAAGASRLVNRQKEAEHADRDGQLLDNLMNFASASKLRERSADSFEQFITAATEDGPVNQVYVDGRVLAEALQQAAPDVQQAIGAIPSVRDKLSEAVATGGDIAIPVGEFVTRFADTGLEQSLIDNIRTDPDGMTRAEAQAYLQSDQAAQLQTEVEQAVSRMEDKDAAMASYEATRDRLAGELAATGRFTQDVTKPYATMFAAFYATQGARLGITAEEFAARYPVRFQAQSLTGQGVMDQQSAEQQLSAYFEGKGYSDFIAKGMAKSVAAERVSNPKAVLTRAGLTATKAVRLSNGVVLVADRYGGREEAAQEATQLLGATVELADASDPRFDEGAELWATKPRVNSDGTVSIQHWGPKGIKQTDPTRWGESGTLPASERSAIASNLPRTFFGVESGKPGGYVVEFPGRTQYEARVPADKIYDIASDPDGFKPAKDVNELERKIKDAGYLGYWTGNDQLGMTATMFDKVDVREIGENGRSVATREDFTPEGIANILDRDNWAVFTAENPMAEQLSDEENKARQDKLKAQLDEMGVEYMRAVGRYAGIEHPFVVMGITEEDAVRLGLEHEQDSVLTAKGLIYPRNGEIDPAVGVVVHDQRPDDFFTEIPETGVLFTIDIDFEAREASELKVASLFQGGVEAYTRREPAAVGEATGVDLTNTLAASAAFARDNRFATGRELKLALQERALAAGVDLSGFDEETAAKLADYVVEDALEAVQDNQNAIGWYDRAVSEAKSQLARLYPEIETDAESEFAFIWALAVTSNGLKVDKNFELAAKAYESWKANGEFPTNIGIGQAAGGINDGLALHKVLISKLGSWKKARDFMIGELPVKEIEAVAGIPISGEGRNELVRGAAILGPKIGNGFFSNLYGHFDALTMDRWLMRTVGRWRGTLIARNPAMEAKKRTEIRELAAELDSKQIKFLNGFFNGSDAKLAKRMSDAEVDRLAEEVAKRSMAPDWRGHINKASGGENLRKLGNGLAKYLDGQVEQPGGAKERAFIRDVFRSALQRLQAKEGLGALTMADLQALLWYPEKLLYETAKKPAGQEVRGYEDDEAPDYANAARKLVAARLGRAGQEGAGSGAAGSGLADQQGTAAADTLNQGEANARGQIQFPSAFPASPATITLLQKADLSTFLHESGHFFLEVMGDMASRGDAPQAVVDDMSTLLRWMGVDSLLTWREMSLEQRREQHEKFARGFEAYLFEGKSPNVEMQGIFQRFRAWLLNVYRSLTALNVELDDDVRQVFDRMLATPDMIREAEAARNMAPLFASAEEAGMTEQEFADYEAKAGEATQEAISELEARGLRDMQWLANARSRLLKQLQADAAAKRAAVRKEVIAEVMSEPVNRAREFLRKGVLDGQAVEGPHKLSLAEMRARYQNASADWFKDNFGYGKYGMLAEDGINPEQVAELFGYSSSDEMVQDLVKAEDAKAKIDGLTDQRMLERYGDLSTPEAMARAADKALHSDARQRFISTELAAINKLAKRPRILAKAIKQFADATIARLRIRDIRPGQYAAAEARAAKASTEAMRKGDTMLAAQEKQNQLVQSYSARAAYDATEEVDKGLRYLKKFTREGTRKSIDPDYVDQIDQLLERYELKAVSNKALDKRASFSAWLEAQKAMGLEPDIPPQLIEQAQRVNYRETTLEDFRGLVDTVRQIEHLGRLKKKLLTAKDKRELDDAASMISETVELYSKGQIDDLRTRDNTSAVLKSLGKSFLALHRKMASLARQMDGSNDGGPVWEFFVRTMNSAADKEAGMRAKATAELSALIKPLLASGKMGGKGTFYPTLGKSFNREERVAIALNLGNAGNMQRLFDGEGWQQSDLAPLLNDITAEEADFVQAIWDYFEGYRPEIAAKERRVYGKEPDWVEPTPITLGGRELRGGYYPIKYDPRRSGKAEQHADAEEAKAMLRGAYTSATTRRSFTKQRADEVHGRPLMYNLAGLYQGTTEVIHDLSWHEWLIDANRLLRHKAVDRAMRNFYGPEAIGVFKSAIQDIAAGDVGAQNVFERSINHIRTGATVAGMGYNLMTSLLQPLGLSQSIVRIGAGNVAKGLRQWLGSPIDTVGEIESKSEFMRLRGLTMQREINEIRNRVGGQSELRANIERSFFLLIQKAQMIADVPTWLGAYEKAIAEGNDENRSIALADQAVRDSQGGGQISDLAGIQRGGALQKLFTNFYSYFNVTYNIASERTAATDFKKPGEVMRLATDYLMLFTVPSILGVLMREALTGGDDDDDLLKKLANDQISYLFGTMIGLREITGAAQAAAGTSSFNTGYQGPAGLRFFGELNKLGKQIDQGEWDKALRKSIVNTAGILFHLPSGQINRTWDGIEAIAEGETSNPAVVVVGPPKN